VTGFAACWPKSGHGDEDQRDQERRLSVSISIHTVAR
jgi:hypothetical protein